MARENTAAFQGLTTTDGRPPRVAIVGGTPSAAMVATMLAEQFGCAPFPAADDKAIMALFGDDARIDLILMDDMRGASALVAAELVRALGQRRALPVLALVEAGARPAPRDGISATLAKPYSPRELFAAMRDALARLPNTLVGNA
jgi:CheY-like chemotaxis protein